MSLFSEMQDAADEAQSTLAQLQGMASGGTNLILNGAALVGVFGNPVVAETMNPGGGWRRRVELPLTITREQLGAAPEGRAQVTRTDSAGNPVYRIEAVDTNDPLHWVMTLVKVGE
jgi:hypothetical protein